MKSYLSLRHPLTAVMVFSLMVLVCLSMFGCPAFRAPGMENPQAGLKENPLWAEALPKKLRKALSVEELRRLSDVNGYAFGISNPLSGSQWQGSRVARDLEQGLGYASENSLPFALKVLGRQYSTYPAKVLGRATNETDVMPRSRNDLIGYGLIRYNRAVVLMQMAQTLDRRDQKRWQFLRRACYDLRRCIGAFERLGRLNEFGGEPYWGRDIMAWDGYSLEPGDSGFSIHQAYANLAIAYLRLGNEDGYPEVELRYMAREERKYTTGQTQLSAVVSLLIQSCLADDEPSNRKYRLTMALQNLEAAGRGMSSDGGALFNYSIGLILAELYRLEEGVEPQHALGFLELAARGNESNAVVAAKRELALLNLELKRDRRFLEALAPLTPAMLRGNQAIDQRQGMQLADMALYGHLRNADWEIVANHLAFRNDELAGQLASEETIETYQKLVTAVCDASMLGLKHRLRQQWETGDSEAVTGYLLGLKADPHLNGDHELGAAFRKRIWGELRFYPGIATSLWLANNPSLRWCFIVAPYLLLLILAGYVVWFYKSHRLQASQRLQSGYVQEIHNSQ